ncbi:MAG: hypothetical protein PF447_13115, partial [Spirochaetaceae bacterium]|nr:hypothetical protein [Spirochaetaceae bacterium]
METSIPEIYHRELRKIILSLLSTLELAMRSLKDNTLFMQVLNDWLEETILWHEFSKHWGTILIQIEQSIPIETEEQRAFFKAIIKDAQVLVEHKSKGITERRYYQLNNTLCHFLDLSNWLNFTGDINELKNIQSNELPL